MNRRHTILAAVLINASLLVLLFATAVKPGSERGAVIVQHPPKSPPVRVVARREPPPAVSEEVKPPVEKPVIERTVPAVETLKPAVVAKKFAEITVKKGDSLDKIARANKTTAEEIAEVNNLTTTCLQIGQMLRVPLPEAKPASAPLKKEEPSEDCFYTVRSGDNPWTIAMKVHVSVEELLKLNDLNEEKARKLRPGDRIRVR